MNNVLKRGRVGWLVDAEMFPDYQANLLAEIERQGHVAKCLPEIPYGYSWEEIGSPYLKLFPAKTCVVAHGSIELASQLAVHSPWWPGVYCDWDALDCARYYCAFGEHLLNANYVMLPFGELARRKSFLFETFGASGSIFVRPSSCRKSFTGQTVQASTFEKDLDFMAFYDVAPETMVVVSSPKEIVSEWRFVVADQRAIAGSLYKSQGKLEKHPVSDNDVWQFAGKMAANDFQPSRVWTLDVCRTPDGRLHLLEIGSFSCAELYACDMATVVREVSRIACEDWESHE